MLARCTQSSMSKPTSIAPTFLIVNRMSWIMFKNKKEEQTEAVPRVLLLKHDRVRRKLIFNQVMILRVSYLFPVIQHFLIKRLRVWMAIWN